MAASSQDATVFGLGFRQHDNRQMQHILRAYSRMPTNPTVRVDLYLKLVFLQRDLEQAEVQAITEWLRHGGEFPAPTPMAQGPINAADLSHSFGGISSDSERIRDEPTSEPEDNVYDDEMVDEDDEMDAQQGINDNADQEAFEREAPEVAPSSQSNDLDDSMVISPSETAGIIEEQKECSICFDSYAAKYFPLTSKITTTCEHFAGEIACLHCIKQTIRTAVKEGALHRITCPWCPSKLSHEEVKAFADKELLSRYEYLVMMGTPDLVMCLGPNCGQGQVHHNFDSQPAMRCNSCGFQTCVMHKLPWHEGMTCDEFDCDESQIERLEADEATAKLLSQNSKICPTCKNGVTKAEGCDHLHCRCGEEWCFVCLASWENIIRIGPTAHGRACDYHPDKIRLRADQKQANATTMAELVHGGPVSEALEQARVKRNADRSAAIRVLALEAAEKRQKAMSEDGAKSPPLKPTRKAKPLLAPWEE